MSHASADAIVAGARRCLGVPVRPQGRNPDVALDCIGVVEVAARAAGIGRTAPSNYSLRSDNQRRLVDGLAAAGCRQIAAGCAMPGDIIETRIPGGSSHVGIVTERGFVHAHFGVGRVVESTVPVGWTIASAWRLPED